MADEKNSSDKSSSGKTASKKSPAKKAASKAASSTSVAANGAAVAVVPAPAPGAPAPHRTPSPAQLYDEIRRRAYEFYCARGGDHGSHEADWHRAEMEVRSKYK